MALIRLVFFVFTITALTAYFIFGLFAAIALGALISAIVLIWHATSQALVLKALKARRLTEATADDRIQRKFLGDGQKLRMDAGLPKTNFAVIDAYVPLAFSFGSTIGASTVVVTSGLFRTLTRLEIAAVIGHEFGHIKAGDSMLNAFRLSYALLMSKLGINLRPKSRNGLLQKMALRQKYKADIFSATLNKDTKILVSALKKLERGVRAVQWNTLDKLPYLASLTFIDPLAAKACYDQPEHSETAHRVAELNRLELPKAA